MFPIIPLLIEIIAGAAAVMVGSLALQSFIRTLKNLGAEDALVAVIKNRPDLIADISKLSKTDLELMLIFLRHSTLLPKEELFLIVSKDPDTLNKIDKFASAITLIVVQFDWSQEVKDQISQNINQKSSIGKIRYLGKLADEAYNDLALQGK